LELVERNGGFVDVWRAGVQEVWFATAVGPNPRAGSLSKFSMDRSLADIPVEQPTAVALSANLKTAKALELAAPPSLLG
jgi:hypothetical protein